MFSSNFSENVFLSALGERCQHCSPKAYALLDSTNTELCRLAREGAPEGTVIFADEQQKGRGRRGHTFFSPLSGLYMSLLLRPQAEVSPLHITTAAAVAVAEAIEQLTGIPAGIKWVNDIYCNGKKVCGILTEGAFFPGSAQLQYAVLGIGINVGLMEFPEELREIATSVSNECGFEVSKEVLIDEVLKELE
ncbi:MAG: biotin--[acetyl-CoA-carboxylase] ligase, partial [Clostridia bacterium]|nr:biotin--[acetyl-CoA-carboxylase] ligase [Clostridia bacterium]